MNVTIQIMGRNTVDTPFTELASTTVVVADVPVPCTPAAPPAAVGQDLALRITANDTVTVQLGQFLDPATRPGPTPILDTQGAVVGEEPAPEPFTRGRYVAWGNQPRQVPFKAGNSIILSRPGAAAA